MLLSLPAQLYTHEQVVDNSAVDDVRLLDNIAVVLTTGKPIDVFVASCIWSLF